MAKKIKTIVKIQITAGQIETPKIGQALGPHGLNLQQVIQQINEATKDKQGFKLPCDIIVYEDRSFTFKLHQPPASALIKKAIGVEKGSGTPNKQTVGTITKAQLKEVAEKKMSDLNTKDVESAMKIVEGTAKSLGIKVV